MISGTVSRYSEEKEKEVHKYLGETAIKIKSTDRQERDPTVVLDGADLQVSNVQSSKSFVRATDVFDGSLVKPGSQTTLLGSWEKAKFASRDGAASIGRWWSPFWPQALSLSFSLFHSPAAFIF